MSFRNVAELKVAFLVSVRYVLNLNETQNLVIPLYVNKYELEKRQQENADLNAIPHTMNVNEPDAYETEALPKHNCLMRYEPCQLCSWKLQYEKLVFSMILVNRELFLNFTSFIII
eukprot:Lithocolla_globosa_v1_NODE_1090_length_2879_cov_37.449912.p3 type:complete len:116 gc:universal NODE_1090_length_2879_cov_37.449912:812-465(-)